MASATIPSDACVHCASVPQSDREETCVAELNHEGDCLPPPDEWVYVGHGVSNVETRHVDCEIIPPLQHPLLAIAHGVFMHDATLHRLPDVKRAFKLQGSRLHEPSASPAVEYTFAGVSRVDAARIRVHVVPHFLAIDAQVELGDGSCETVIASIHNQEKTEVVASILVAQHLARYFTPAEGTVPPLEFLASAHGVRELEYIVHHATACGYPLRVYYGETREVVEDRIVYLDDDQSVLEWACFMNNALPPAERGHSELKDPGIDTLWAAAVERERTTPAENLNPEWVPGPGDSRAMMNNLRRMRRIAYLLLSLGWQCPAPGASYSRACRQLIQIRAGQSSTGFSIPYVVASRCLDVVIASSFDQVPRPSCQSDNESNGSDSE